MTPSPSRPLVIESGYLDARLATLDRDRAARAGEGIQRWIDSVHEDANGIVWTTKAELRAALAASPTTEPRLAEEQAAIEAGTHNPASDDFGNQYLARISPTTEPGDGLDAMILRRALERGLAAVDDEWTIEELAELTAHEYAALAEPRPAGGGEPT